MRKRDTAVWDISCFKYILISQHHISCLTGFWVCVCRIMGMCVCASVLQCACVLILSERLRFCFVLFVFCTGRHWGGLPGGPQCAGPVSLREWAWIRRLPTRTHGRLSWQSEAHWPVTEIKRRAISQAKTTCGTEGEMESRRRRKWKETQGDVRILTVTCRFGKWRLLSIPAFVVHL